MSFFAKVLICVNAGFSLVLCGMLAILLAHKFDYKNKHRLTHNSAVRAQEDLERARGESKAAQQIQQRKLLRFVQERSEADQANKTLESEVDRLKGRRSDVEREVSKLEAEKRGKDDKVKELQERSAALREEISRLEKEREDNLTERQTFDQQRDELIKKNFELATELSAQSKRLDDLGNHLRRLEDLWLYIAKNYPGLGPKMRIPMVDMAGVVSTIAGDVTSISLGRDDGAKVGGLIQISRGAVYVATLELRNVRKEESWGVVTQRGPGFPPRPGDEARTSAPIGPPR